MTKTIAKSVEISELCRVDRLIINELQKQPSISNVKLAQNCGVSEYQLQERLTELHEEKIIETQRIFKLRKEQQSVLFITIGLDFDISNVNIINEDLKEIPEVYECYFISGDYQILCKVIYDGDRESYDSIFRDISEIKGITKLSVITCFQEKFYKRFAF